MVLQRLLAADQSERYAAWNKPMTVIVRFNTRMFDVTCERPNPINPIPGESLLIWLNEKLHASHAVTEPDAEDWGWYSSIEWNGIRYMLGSSTSELESGEQEWVLQIVRSRSLKEQLLGRGRASITDPCVVHIVRLLFDERGFKNIQVEPAT